MSQGHVLIKKLITNNPLMYGKIVFSLFFKYFNCRMKKNNAWYCLHYSITTHFNKYHPSFGVCIISTNYCQHTSLYLSHPPNSNWKTVPKLSTSEKVNLSVNGLFCRDWVCVYLYSHNATFSQLTFCPSYQLMAYSSTPVNRTDNVMSSPRSSTSII